MGSWRGVLEGARRGRGRYGGPKEWGGHRAQHGAIGSLQTPPPQNPPTPKPQRGTPPLSPPPPTPNPPKTPANTPWVLRSFISSMGVWGGGGGHKPHPHPRGVRNHLGSRGAQVGVPTPPPTPSTTYGGKGLLERGGAHEPYRSNKGIWGGLEAPPHPTQPMGGGGGLGGGAQKPYRSNGGVPSPPPPHTPHPPYGGGVSGALRVQWGHRWGSRWGSQIPPPPPSPHTAYGREEVFFGGGAQEPYGSNGRGGSQAPPPPHTHPIGGGGGVS